MKIMIATLVLSFAVSTRAIDFRFDQDISFRGVFNDVESTATGWQKIPFSDVVGKQATIHLNSNRDCFIALSDGEVFGASRQIQPQTPSTWSSYASWASISNAISGAQLLIDQRSFDFDFFVVTNNNILGVSLTHGPLCGQVQSTKEMLSAPLVWGTVFAVASSEKYLWVASSSYGLQQFDSLTGAIVNQINLPDTNVTAMIFVSTWNKLFVGTNTALYTLTCTTSDCTTYSTEHEWITGVLDSAPVQFSFDAVHDCLWIAESGAVHKLDTLGRYWRFGYHQGSPFGGITSVAAVNGYVYVGSAAGLARMRSDSNPAQVDTLANNQPAVMVRADASGATAERSAVSVADPWVWSFYGGPRYLPDNAVSNIVAASADRGGSSSVVLVSTATGLTLLETSLWTLEQKAAVYEQFQLPRHDRRKLTSSCGLREFGNLDSYVASVSDNDGLWTSMHALGEAYNFAATGSQTARDLAWRAFEALETLSNATGAYPNYVARSYCYWADGDSGCGTASGEERWHNSTVIEGLLWKDDTSSDEMNGHLAAYPVLYDLVASTAEEKQRVYALIDGITQGIVDNDLYLIDPLTTKPTTWGFWNPSAINDNAEHYSERDLNSLEILGYLASAYSITRKAVYKDTFQKLVSQHGYGRNIMNVKIDNPDDDNHSDNELIMLAYHILFYAWRRVDVKAEPAFKTEMWEMVSIAVPSLERTWLLIGAEYSPLWTGIYAGVASQPASELAVSRSVWTLRRWALDLIAWPIDNSQRWDLTVQPFHARNNEDMHIFRQIRPASERVSTHWNTDPYVMSAGSGTTEYEPAVWRLPYYMMRYYGLV